MSLSHRLAALAIDVVLVGVVMLSPLTSLSHAGQEVAAVVLGVAVGTAYLGGSVARWGQTVGLSLLRLAVVDARTGSRVRPARAVARGFLVVLEVGAAPTVILALPALAELASAAASGRSLTDYLVGTRVVPHAPPPE